MYKIIENENLMKKYVYDETAGWMIANLATSKLVLDHLSLSGT